MFDIDDVQFSLRSDQVETIITVSLYNPSSKNLYIPSTEFEITLDNDRLGSGKMDGIQLLAGKTSTGELKLIYRYSDLFSEVAEAVYRKFWTGTSIEVNVNGVAHIKVLFIGIDLPFHASIINEEKQGMQIITSPELAYVNEEVLIKVVDSNGFPIEGVNILGLESIHSITSDKMIENGKMLGKTNGDGELSYTFTNLEIYVIGATRARAQPISASNSTRRKVGCLYY